MTTEELTQMLPEIKRSHSWMVESIQHGADEANEGNYSDELQHSIAVQEWLEKMVK